MGDRNIQLRGFEEEDIPLLASRRSIEQADKYDIVGYIEDVLIEDNEFRKLLPLFSIATDYANAT